MAVTARVTILMDQAQKATLTQQAREEGLSVGEFIRNRALDQDHLLAALVRQLRDSTREAMTTIDQTLARMDAREQAIAEREVAVRQAAQAEFAGLDLDALARHLAPAPAARRRGAAP